MVSSTIVSMSCAWMIGPRTTIIGSFGNTGVPSSTDQTSHSNLKFARYSRNFSLN